MTPAELGALRQLRNRFLVAVYDGSQRNGSLTGGTGFAAIWSELGLSQAQGVELREYWVGEGCLLRNDAPAIVTLTGDGVRRAEAIEA